MKSNKKPTDEPASIVEDAVVAYGPRAAAMPIKTLRGLSERFEITLGDFAEILEVTPKTLHRWKAQDASLSPQQADRVDIVCSIFGLGTRVLGSQEAVNSWMREPVLLLGGRKPRDLLKTESGRRAVEGALRQIELGMF